MNKKSKVILCLLTVAVILFCAVRFWIIPANQAKEDQRLHNQSDALTHDISAIEDYRAPYLGDASNVGGLFEALPLNDISRKFEIDSENCTLKVNYLDTVWNIGEEKVQRNLIYNSAAAMAAIDNLSGITYSFPDNSYSFSRIKMEAVFGSPLSNLLEEDNWSKKVQNKLTDMNFVGQFF